MRIDPTVPVGSRNAPPRWPRKWGFILCGILLLFVVRARAVNVDAMLNLGGGLVGPTTVSLAVSTYPVRDITRAFDPSVYVASAIVAIPSLTANHNFSALPFLGSPTTYYFYGYVDSDFDLVMGSTDPMGGFGPFPYHQVSAIKIAFSAGDTGSISMDILPRARFTGTVSVTGSPVGERIVVRAIETVGGDMDLVQMSVLPLSGGAYTLDGLKPTGNEYQVEAWIDTELDGEEGMGEWNAHELKGTVLAGTPMAGDTITNLDIALSSTGVSGTNAPNHLRILGPGGSWRQSVRADNPTADLVFSLRDVYDVSASTPTPTPVYLTGFNIGGMFDPEVSTDTIHFVTSISSPVLVISGGSAASVPFRVRVSTPGNASLRAYAPTLPNPYAWFDLTVLPSDANFSNLRARTTSQPADSTGTTAAITPDWDGVDDGAILSCTPPSADSGWQLLISTDASFQGSIVQRHYGYGTGEAYWYGNGMEGRTVPNGTYFARFQTEGEGIVSATCAVTIQAAGIQGRVVDAGLSPLSDVEVSINGPGGAFQRTDANGYFFANGLRGESSYQIQMKKSGYSTVTLSTMTGAPSAAAVDVGTSTLTLGVALAVSVQVSSAPLRDIYGGVNVYNNAANDYQWGTVHLVSGSTQSDNGRYAGDVQFSTQTILTVRPNLSYQVEVNLPDFGRSVQTVTSPSTGTLEVLFFMARKANVYGRVEFPTPVNSPYGGEWVSVDAIPSGTTLPVGWGGTYLPNGQTTGIYQLFGVAAGSYTLRAIVRGYIPQLTTVTVGTSDLGNPSTGGVDFLPFDTGGQILGTVTVIGDTTGMDSGAACGGGYFPVNLNAFSRATYGSAFSQVCLPASSTSTSGGIQLSGLADGNYEMFSYLEGFELVPPGPQTVTVSGGSGSKNITFQALTGQVQIQANIPDGDAGELVSYQLTRDFPNPISRAGSLVGSPTAHGTETRLGTGLYTLVVQNNNPGRGLRQETAVAVTNGSLSTVTVDLTVPAYSVSGSLDVEGNILLPSTWSVTVSSVQGLGMAGIIPQVDVYRLPLPDHFEWNFHPLRSVYVTIDPDSATYHIPGLAPGGYLLHVREDLNPSSSSCSGCTVPLGLPEMASDSQRIYVDGTTVDDVDLTLTNGAKVSGVISRPSGDTSTDVRQFILNLRRSDNLTVWASSVQTTASGTASYAFPHVAPGDYVLEIKENAIAARYGAQSQSVTVVNTDLTVDVSLVTAGTIVGRLRDADTQTLLTSDNVTQYLSQNFEIAAQANPWVQGGYYQSVRTDNGVGINNTTGQFRVPRLIPGATYDLRLRGYTSLSGDDISKGVRTYAPVVLAGIQISDGQTVDVGTIDLKQGTVISGVVRDNAGAPLPNIRVSARPAQGNGGNRWDLQVETFTKEDGRYEIQGVDRGQRYYDVIASPRFRQGESYARLAGPRYAEERLRMVDVNDADKLINNNFTLTLANGVVTGTVTSVDEGILYPAFTDDGGQEGERGADIVLHREGAPFDDNPLGEIEERTEANGAFRVEGLKPGAYTLRALALGYTSTLKSIVVPAGSVDAGTMTLGKGARVSGAITKPDGSSPSLNEVNMVLGVDANFEEFVFGTIDKNSDTQLVSGYSISGFRTGKPYSLVIVTSKDEILEVQSGVTFVEGEGERVIPLLFRPAPPHVFVNQSQSVSGVTRVTSMRFFVSQPLRNVTTEDNDLSQLLRLDAGGGTLSDVELSSSRDTLTAVYTAPVDEASFSVRAAFFTNAQDPASTTGANFYFDKTYAFYAGIAARRSADISNVTGGECTLEGVATGVTFEAGAFDVDTSTTVEVGIQSADSLESLPAGAPRLARASALARSAQRLGSAAYPSPGLFRAIAAAPAVNPFSAFYDIFLPAGINHRLKKEALLTLTYDASVADPTALNVYFYDPIHNVFLLENAERTLDTVNRTITVSVGHLSTFVVLPRQTSIIGTNGYTGQEIHVHNVPNPFNIKTKTITLNEAEAADQTQTIEGTMIRYSLPEGKTGEVKIEIYDVSGGLVRVLTHSAPSGGTHYYLEWDGRNDAGKPVASGLYLARFTLNGGDEKMFKMAVLK